MSGPVRPVLESAARTPVSVCRRHLRPVSRSLVCRMPFNRIFIDFNVQSRGPGVWHITIFQRVQCLAFDQHIQLGPDIFGKRRGVY